MAIANPAAADTITIGASKDATIYGGNVNNSNGGGPGFFAGTDGDASPLRGLIAFDVADALPQGATINSVQLTLVLGLIPGHSGPANVTIELHKLTADWGEGTTLTQNPPSDTIGTTGQGVAANSGDSTWNARQFSPAAPTLWATPGGDFVSSASASATIGSTLNIGYSWGTTSALVADVQSWLDNPDQNFGWSLINTDEMTTRTQRAFFTREANTATDRPELKIDFDAPAPSLLGDFNQDHHVNSADVLAMLNALTDLAAFKTLNHLSDAQLLAVGDINGDGNLTNQDLQSLLNLLRSGDGSISAVPEPKAWQLVLVAVPIVASFQSRNTISVFVQRTHF